MACQLIKGSARFSIVLCLMFTLGCSDDLDQDATFKVVVKGFEKEPLRDSLGSATPSNITLELAQITLLETDQTEAVSLLDAEQEESFEIITRDTKVFSKKLEDALLNKTYSSLGVFFKTENGSGQSAFICTTSDGTKLIPQTTGLDQPCNSGRTLCIENFTSPTLEGVGGYYDSSFSLKKAKDVKVSIQLNWKNIVDTSIGACIFPDIEVVVD